MSWVFAGTAEYNVPIPTPRSSKPLPLIYHPQERLAGDETADVFPEQPPLTILTPRGQVLGVAIGDDVE